MNWCSTHHMHDTCDEQKPKDPLTAQWDEVDTLLKSLPKSKQGMLYQTLYNLGWRQATVESEIKRAWKDEHAK